MNIWYPIQIFITSSNIFVIKLLLNGFRINYMLSVYAWIEFNFQDIQIAVVNQERYAATDGTDNIIVWQKKENVSDLISIIISPISVKDIKWVRNTPNLAIIGDEQCLIWDVYENKKLSFFKIRDRINYIIRLNNKLYVYSGGSIKEIGGKKIVVDFSWIYDNRIYYKISSGVFVLNGERLFNKKIDNVRKQIIRQNDTELNGEIVIYGEFRRTPRLQLPPGMRQYLVHNSILIIYLLDKLIVYQSPDFFITTNRKKNPNGAIVSFDGYGVLYREKDFYTISNQGGEMICTEKILSRSLADHIKQENIFFSNAPSFLFAGRINQRLSRINVAEGFFMIADGSNHTLFDMFDNTCIDFPVTRYKKNTFVLLEENKRYLLEWDAGGSPPLGMLKKRELNNSTEILYNQEKHVKVEEDDFLSKRDNLSNLIVREWHSVLIDIKYGGTTVDQIRLSLSSLYYFIEYWSKLELITELTYDNYPEDSNRMIYGDLEVDGHNFYGIAPMWARVDNFVATVSYDGRCYLWSIGNNIPLLSFELGVPLLVKISPNKRFIAGVSLYSDDYDFHTKTGKTISALSPMIRLVVYDRERDEYHRKELPFVTHLIDDLLSIEMEEEGIVFKFPSYIDLEHAVSYIFTDKFHRYNPSKYKRYWMTHSTNTKSIQDKQGVEFPVDPHPEIRRELHFRPFKVYERAIVNKKDDIAVIVGIIEDTHDQISEVDLYSYHDALKLSVPYARERMVDVYFKYVGDIVNDRFIAFSKLDKIPKMIKYQCDHVGKRFELLLKNIIKDNAVHNVNGIAYQSTGSMRKVLARYIS